MFFLSNCPGTHLEKRLTRGDQGINSLDAVCREHDIDYSHSNDLAERHVADNILAWKREGEPRNIFRQFWQSSTAEEISAKYLENNVTQSIITCLNVMIKAIVVNCACNFYKWLTINLKTDIVLFKLNIKYVIDTYIDRQE